MDSPDTASNRRLLLTVEEAAKLLSISRATLYPFVMSGQCRSVLIGRSRRVPLAALEEFVRKLS